MPTDAAELWMMPVNSAPTRTPRSGLRKAVSRLANSGISARGLTALLMNFMPYISTAKPTKIEPMSLRLGFLDIMMRTEPTMAKIREKFSGFRSFSHTLSVSSPTSESSQAVSVVPMLEPIMTPGVCAMFIRPELTRPTSMTVTAEDDWTATVMPAPRARLFSGLEVMRLRACSSLPPAIRSRPEDMTCIP